MLNARAQKLVDSLPEDFEAALISTGVSRFYLLDFDAHDAGTLLLLPGRMVYIIDSRYIELASREVSCADVVLEESTLEQVAQVLREERVAKLYLEDKATLEDAARMREAFKDVRLDTTATLSGAIMALRQVKDEEEVARMRAAQKITDDCFGHILPFIKQDVREVDLMLEMEHYMRAHGAEQVAFDTICIGGANTSLPHGVPGEYRLQKGDFITMDFGARVKGYCADMTRTVALGEPGEEKRRVYDAVLRAHLAGIQAVKAGAACADVDRAARDIIDEAGYKGRFGHGLGHAVGIQVHEAPRFSPKSKDSVKAGMMMTVEPGVYLPGQFGCRIEDMVLVTQTGCLPLPHSGKQLMVL